MFFRKKTIKDVVDECEEIFEYIKSKTCCFTGHRPQKLPWGFNEDDERCKEMISKATIEIEDAISKGYDTFITGMAIGFDMICAEIVLTLKKKYKHIKLVGAIPCKGQEKPWRAVAQQRYNKILKQLNWKWIGSETYTDECMHKRNDYMLNNSSLVIALFDGKRGGTQSTILKAEKQGLKIKIINP